MKRLALLVGSIAWCFCTSGHGLVVEKLPSSFNLPENQEPSPPIEIENPYAPQENDESMATRNAYVEETEWDMESGTLRLGGSLPTPCNQLRVTTEVKGNYLIITAYSIYPPDALCAQVLEPFDATLTTISLPDTIDFFIVNGQVLEAEIAAPKTREDDIQLEIENPYAMQAGDSAMSVCNAYLKDTLWDADTGTLQLFGNLPSPCNELRVAVSVEGSNLITTVYSVYPPDVLCTQMLEPFAADLTISSMPEAITNFIVNGRVIQIGN